MSWTQTDTSFKKLSNKRITTSTGKGLPEEKGASTLELYLPDIKTGLIPGTGYAGYGVSGYLFYHGPTAAFGQTLVVDTSVPGNLTWFATTGWGNTTTANDGSAGSEAQRLGDWISDKYDAFGTTPGAGYEIKVYDRNNNLITKSDNSNWLFDYQTGILVFNNDATSIGTGISTSGPFKIVGWRYIGPKGIIPASYGGLGYTSYNLGDLIVGAGSTIIPLPLGTNSYILSVDTSTPSGLKWIANTGGSGGSGLTSLNNLTSGQQYFATGTSGSAFNISSSGSTHTFNIPIAGVASTGLVSTQSQTFAGQKTFTSPIIADLTGTATTAGFASTSSYSYQSGYAITSGSATTSANINVSYAATGTFYPLLSNVFATTSGVGLSVNNLFSFNTSNGSFGATSVNIFSGQSYSINGISVISSSSLGVGVTNSSLTSLGVVTSGTWSATAITALYGGTGYSSYTKGDLLVGVGNTFIKLGVGTYNQALLADSSTPSGLKWGTVTGSGSGSGISIYITDIAPTTANSGDLWFNSESAILSVFYNDIDSNQWVEVGVNLAAIENIQNVGIGITKLNNLGSSSQYFTTGTTGSGFNITSTGSYHFFNIPIASTAATGLVSGLAQTFGGNKTFSNGLISSTGATIYGNLYLPDNPLASIYGGTGYSNYSLGDLVVGAGNSTIKLSKGPDRYVLQSNPAFASGLGWTNANGGVAVSTVPPTNPFAGDLWWNSGDGSLSVYYNDVSGDNFWVEIEHGPGTGTVVVSGGTGGTGLTSLNGLTDFAQYFQTGSSGVSFNISSVGSTHTFNIPNAGNGVTGLVTGTTQSFSGNKTFINNVVISSSTASTNLTTGALTVTGGVGIGGTLSSSVVSVNETFDILASNLTTSSTALNQVVHSVGATSYRTMKYTIQITSGSDYNAQEILLLHDGSTVYMTEYAQILAGSGLTLSTFDADINSGNVRLLVSPTNAVTTYKLSCTAMRV